MRIYTGRNHLLFPALTALLRDAMRRGDAEAHIVVVPRQLTLQTERALLAALELQGSFDLQVLSPARLCARVFEAAGRPEGVRVDERGRVMLVRRAVEAAGDRLRLYADANRRRGFADRCARQLELIRQAELGPERLRFCAEESGGMLGMKLMDLAAILEEYEALIDGRFQDGESEFGHAAALAKDADFLRRADVWFYGFDQTPPTLHALMGAVGAACPDTGVFLPLENDPDAPDYDCFLPMEHALRRLWEAARRAGAEVERVRLAPEDGPSDAMRLPAPPQHPELALLARELFAFPARPSADPNPPRRVQAATLRNPTEECRFAAALCRRLAMRRGWRWNDMQIVCRDLEAYHQPLREAFRAYGVPLFLSSSRPAARHPLAEALVSALRLAESSALPEDALALLHSGYAPVDPDEADRLSNHAVKYGLRARALLSPLRKGTEEELAALEPVRARFAEPIVALRRRLRAAKDLKGQLAAVFGYLEDTGAPRRLEDHLNRLVGAGLREQAGEEGQVWNRIIGALDQMAGLMGDGKLSARDLRETLSESLEAAVIKPLPQSDDAVFAQPGDRMPARSCRALLILGETDHPAQDQDGLLNPVQRDTFARLAHAWLGPDAAELSRMNRFYLKCAVGMTSDYLCVTAPLSGADNGARHPGMLFSLLKGLFPGLSVRGGLTGDGGLEWMLRAAPAAALAAGAQALSGLAGGGPLADCDAAALAGAAALARKDPALARELGQVRAALDHGRSAGRLDPRTARALYGALRRQSVTRLEKFALCPFAYFTQYGLKPEVIEPWTLTPADEGGFFHDAVHEFLLASKDDLADLPAEAAERRMDAIADRLLDAMLEGPLGDSALARAERRRLKATARNCANALAEHMRGSRFAPSALETAFGAEDGPARLTIRAASGECTLEGRIDRVDEWLEGGYLRVIDYKRGGRALDLDAVYHGLSLQLPVYLAAATQRRGERSAGVYYFPVKEGLIDEQSTDPNAVEALRRDSLRLSGLAPDDPEVLKALSPDFQDVLGVKLNRDGSLSKGSVVTDEGGFRALMDRALEMAGQHLDGIRGGDVRVAPARFRLLDPCRYCDWKAACLFDERLDKGCLRSFPTMRPADVITAVKQQANLKDSAAPGAGRRDP